MREKVDTFAILFAFAVLNVTAPGSFRFPSFDPSFARYDALRWTWFFQTYMSQPDCFTGHPSVGEDQSTGKFVRACVGRTIYVVFCPPS